MAMTNTQKRAQERDLLRDAHMTVRQQVLQDKSTFYNEDGEDISDKYDIIVKTSDDQVRALQGNSLMELHTIENGKFILAFFESARLMQDRFESLSPQDIARLMFIGTYVAWETNRLQSDNGKKILRKKDVKEMVGMSPNRFNELYKRYKAEGILIEGESGELFLNPTVVYRGNVKDLGSRVSDLSHTRIFRKTVRDLYEQFKGRKLGQLALVYSVIPFLNFDSNIVCYNPEEKATDLIKPISVTVLADILGYKDASKLKTALNGVKIDGEPMFTFAENPRNRREKRTIVNPRIIFAGNGEGLEVVKAIFN